MPYTQTEREATRSALSLFSQWAQTHRSLLIGQTLSFYDINFVCLHRLYQDQQVLKPRASYRCRDFSVASQLLEHSRHTARIAMHCRLRLSSHHRDLMHLLSLRLLLYLDTRQAQLCPSDDRWQVDLGGIETDQAARRWLLGRYLNFALTRLARQRVTLK